MIYKANIVATLNQISRMLRYFKPKSASPATNSSADSDSMASASASACASAGVSVTTSAQTAVINTSFSTSSPDISSSDSIGANGNIVRTRNTEQSQQNSGHVAITQTTSAASMASAALAEYYKQIGLTSDSVQQGQEQIVAYNLVTGTKEGHHTLVVPTESVEYQIRPENEAAQCHVAEPEPEGDTSLHNITTNSACASQDTVSVALAVAAVSEQAEEQPAKRLKLDVTSETKSSAADQDESGTPTHNHQVFTGNTWRPPSSSPSSSVKTKGSTVSRDTSRLPSEEHKPKIGCSMSSRDTSKLPSEEHGRKIGLQLTPEMKAMLMWQKVRAENLDCDYVKVFNRREADELFEECEKTLTYFTGDLAQIKVYGKRYDIPRKQVAHGDEGVTYTYSGVCVPAKPWTPVLNLIRERIQEVTQHTFNFVLINRYEDGNHYMGEHRDDEKDLRRAAPIASVSLGCTRDFVFRHADSRGREAKRQIPPIKLQLEHGSLLVMKYPTNVYWYHSLPVRRKAVLPRINLTFRDIVIKDTK